MVKHRAPRNKNYLLTLGCTLALASIIGLLVYQSLTHQAPVKNAAVTASTPDPRESTADLLQEKTILRAEARVAFLAVLAEEKAAKDKAADEAVTRAETRKKAQEKAAAQVASQKAAAAVKAKEVVVIPVPIPVSSGVASYQAYAAGKVSASEYACLVPMWTKESGWNPNAQNPTSTAYGIAQFLDSTWAGTGYAKTSDPYTQIDAGIVYVNKAYGGACNAWAFWQAHSYY